MTVMQIRLIPENKLENPKALGKLCVSLASNS